MRRWYGRERATGILVGHVKATRFLKAVLDDGREVLVEFNQRNHPYGPLAGRRVEVGVHPDPKKPARLIRIERLLEFLQRRETASPDSGGESDSG